jgi:GTP pyrophosphokinase
MRTIAPLPEAKQKRSGRTLGHLRAAAHRLGIQDVKWQLEDLAAVLHPKRYADEAMVLQHAGERDRYLEDVVGAVRCDSTGRSRR